MSEDTIKMYSAEWWSNQLQRDEKRLRDDWHNYARKIVKRYLDKREGERKEKRLNLFWTNIGIMKAALYAKDPKPMVSRTWSDQNDNIGRVGALMLQRYLEAGLRKKDSDMSVSIKRAVEDRLIPGLGTVWLRYNPTIVSKEYPATLLPDGTELSPAQTLDEITDEEVCVEYTHWNDLVFPSARTSDELWYKARRLYKTKSWVQKRFGKKIAEALKEFESDYGNGEKMLPKNFTKDKVEFFEIWCKRSKKVYWFSKHLPKQLMDEADDPLGLDGFYPSPEFLMATHSTDDYMPRPDYYMVKDQYDALDTLNTRISLLEQALRVVGVYNKKSSELKRMLTDAAENSMIPVENWAMLAEGGGIKGQVDWFPIEQVVITLEKLTIQKGSKIEEIYMLTGISDIMRGDTNARETLGAQQIKAQYSSVRLQLVQGEVADFARQVLAIKAEIACNHFQDHTWAKVTAIAQTPDAQFAAQALELIRDKSKRDFLIDINEESLALPDYNQERDMRVEFLTTIGQFFSQVQGIVESMPEALPTMVQMVKWVSAGFRGSSEIQGVLDQALEGLLKKGPPQPPPPPDPNQDPKVISTKIKAEADVSIAQMKGEGDMSQEALKGKVALTEQAMANGLQLDLKQIDQAIAAMEMEGGDRTDKLKHITEMMKATIAHHTKEMEIDAQPAQPAE